jgi:SAM-dependent methyltransferase
MLPARRLQVQTAVCSVARYTFGDEARGLRKYVRIRVGLALLLENVTSPKDGENQAMAAEETQANQDSNLHPYTEEYYSYLAQGTWASAKEMVPLVMQLVQPRSVVDVGCGIGIWLSVFMENGVKDVLGVDGAYVNKKQLQIPQERFIAADLEQHFAIGRKFDLVVSLEVAEHLSSDTAEAFVGLLTELGPLVLFSAAIPLQGGTHHVNEQWPEYWVKLFDERGYVVVDLLRRKVWNNEKVEPWYTQNVLIFVARERLESYPLLRKEYELQRDSMLSIVHPTQYLTHFEGIEDLKEEMNASLKRALDEVEELNGEVEELKEAAKLKNVLARETRNFLPPYLYRLLRSAYRVTNKASHLLRKRARL